MDTMDFTMQEDEKKPPTIAASDHVQKLSASLGELQLMAETPQRRQVQITAHTHLTAPEPNCTYTTLGHTGASPYRYRITLDGVVQEVGVVPAYERLMPSGNLTFWGPFHPTTNERVRIEMRISCMSLLVIMDAVPGGTETEWKRWHELKEISVPQEELDAVYGEATRIGDDSALLELWRDAPLQCTQEAVKNHVDDPVMKD